MSVRIVDGIGRTVFCQKCNYDLILSSSTDYKCCDNCGFENDLKPKHHWYNNLDFYILCFIYFVFIVLLIVFKK